jgi:hypothetical protein
MVFWPLCQFQTQPHRSSDGLVTTNRFRLEAEFRAEADVERAQFLDSNKSLAGTKPFTTATLKRPVV